MKAPFPYFGGKSRVTDIVWQRFGNPRSYIEPFCGSMAMLLASAPRVEIVNDMDGLLVNFWRAVQADPEAVARWAAAPKTEIDMQSRHNFVYDKAAELVESMRSDPTFYDTQCAGYWVYCRCVVIGGRGLFAERFGSRIPNLSDLGIFAQERRDQLPDVMGALAARLRHVTIACGDWKRVLSPVAICWPPTAVFLDPPYDGSGEDWDEGAYMCAGNVFSDVLEWCNERGDDPNLRIALCGYEGIEPPAGWSTHEWEASGGHGNRTNGRARENAARERIWFSPHCLSEQQVRLL
jgi:DNA adenine methylase